MTKYLMTRRQFARIGMITTGTLALATAAGLAPSSWLVQPAQAAGGEETDWFFAAKWGVFTHFLGEGGQNAASWNQTVNNFDVDAVANQLHSIGARYYIFTLGQNSGYYCSPNATYDSYVGYSPSHCSTRDLIADLYTALAPRGIKLMAYLPAGAPEDDAQAVTALNWSKGAYRNAAFQQKWENVIREWSNRWGENVGGWWFDGCYWPDAMYNFATVPNWNSFAAAARAGNSHSLVAFNPGVENPVNAMCPQEDYAAGEINDVAQVSCPGRFISAGANAAGGANTQIQWHMLSYLGQTWANYDSNGPRFSRNQVVSYTTNLLTNGGVVSWDTGLQPPLTGGSLDPQFVDQLRGIRMGLGVSGDLALNSTAELQNNSGSPLPANSGTCYASNAFDGNPSTIAQAGEEWAWTLHDDLGAIYHGVYRVHVRFGPGYATDFQILLSTDQSSWTTVASVTNWSGAPYIATFNPTDARYVRVRALAPNGPNQPGEQMGIHELQVFHNLALDTIASLQDNSGNALPANSASALAANATDGNSATFAQAANSWAWTLHDDLGVVRSNIGKVTVTFGGGYATDFQILLSTDQSSWATVASVTGWNGSQYTATFSARSARYIRVWALAPNGPNQTGGQMTITELGVYMV